MERTKLTENGRILIPAKYRKTLGLEPDDEVVIRLKGAELRICKKSDSIAKARGIIKRYVAKNVGTV